MKSFGCNTGAAMDVAAAPRMAAAPTPASAEKISLLMIEMPSSRVQLLK
jgi:hypothetical protein